MKSIEKKELIYYNQRMSEAVERALKILKSLDGYGVEVVAATKTRSIAEIKDVLNNTSIGVAGENRVQELMEKYDEGVTWDFIGQLQTNKVKYIAGKVRLIHSVDRENLLAEIDKESKKRQINTDILMEINTAAEESKGGLLFADAAAFAEKTRQYKNVTLKGIMAVTPLWYEKNQLEECFHEARRLFEDLKKDFGMSVLSMGMSGDYLLAADCGATMVRLGRAIFGQRY